jgi:hypothetical protein
MPRPNIFLPLALATLSATALQAQTDPAGQTTLEQNNPAPIVRSAPPQAPRGYGDNHYGGEGRPTAGQRNYNAALKAGEVLRPVRGIANAQPVAGVSVRVAAGSALRVVALEPGRTELKLEDGLANISVHDPADKMLLLVDLPNGEVQMLKNGFYTFNAATNTVRVLRGEANAFETSAPPEAKPIKVKEDHALTFAVSGKPHTVEFYPFQAQGDLIGAPRGDSREAYGDGPGYAPGGYGYGFYGGPGWDYGWGGPWGGWGYPGFGLGWGGGFYGGGYYGGGFYGGGGGFRGGGYRGFGGGGGGGFRGGGGRR